MTNNTLKKDLSIKQKWESFDRLVIDPNAPEIQREEMKKAFYAGIYSILCMQDFLISSSIPIELAAEQIELWNKECVDFSKESEESTWASNKTL